MCTGAGIDKLNVATRGTPYPQLKIIEFRSKEISWERRGRWGAGPLPHPHVDL